MSDLTRMLLSSTSFSSFLDNLSANPAAAPQGTSVKAEQNQPQEQSQVPKDVNPYNGQFSSQQQIGMAMIPESSVDFSLVGFDSSSYNFQPQVFVVDRLDVPNVIDAAILSEKPSSLLDLPIDCDEEKVEVPVIERPAEVKIVHSAPATVVDEEFESDPEFALFHSEPANTSAVTEAIDATDLPDLDLFGGIDSEKVLARIDLVDASDEEASAALAMARVQRLSARIGSVTARLEALTADL